MTVIAGYIHLDRKGQYAFVFASNDGVRLEIGGKRILQDPDVHSDRFSDTGYFDVKTPGWYPPGWYPIAVRYFERRNTSTLALHLGSAGRRGHHADRPARGPGPQAGGQVGRQKLFAPAFIPPERSCVPI